MLANTRRVESSLECHPDTLALYQYWLKRRGVRAMPRRADLDPTEIPPHLLPGVSLVDVVDDERRYVYRLVGTADVQIRGFDPTGRSVREAYWPSSAEDSLGCYDRVVAMRAPFFDPTPERTRDGRYETVETLFLPLSDDGRTVNKIMVFFPSRDVQRPGAVVRLTL